MANQTQTIPWYRMFKNGQNYMNSWPEDKRLSFIFPENRVIKATRFAIRFMPPIAVFTLVWQITMGGALGVAVSTALFACSLSLQGLWWLGYRAKTALPPSLKTWFDELCQKLAEFGEVIAPLEHPATYQHLAEVLQRAFRHLDDTFLDKL